MTVDAESAGSASRPARSYLARHWRGELTLARSYWIDWLLLSLVVGALGMGVGALDPQPHPRLVSWAAVIFLLAVTPLIALWQMVGVWRSAGHHVERGGKRRWVWIVRAIVVLGVASFCVRSVVSTIPASREFLSIATGRDAISGYRLRVLRDGTELEMAGPIGFGLTDDVRRLLDANPRIGTIHLNSVGGRVAEARALAALIEARGLKTYSATLCASACILAYAAGSERLLAPSATMGFHQYGFPGASNLSFELEYAKDRAFLRSRGVRDDFIDKAFATPNKGLWTPSQDELYAAHFVTGRPTSDQVGISGMSVASTADLDAALGKVPLYAVLRETDPDVYAAFRADLVDAVAKGRSIAEVRATLRPKLAALRDERLPRASNAAALDFARLMLDEWRVLQLKDPALCFAYAVGGAAASVEQAIELLPEALKNREADALAGVLRAGKVGGAPPQDGFAAQVSLDRSIQNARAMHGDDLLTLDRLDDPAVDKAAACNAIVALYDEITGLPPEEAGPVLRLVYRK